MQIKATLYFSHLSRWQNIKNYYGRETGTLMHWDNEYWYILCRTEFGNNVTKLHVLNLLTQ